jgi:hypothetical protein
MSSKIYEIRGRIEDIYDKIRTPEGLTIADGLNLLKLRILNQKAVNNSFFVKVLRQVINKKFGTGEEKTVFSVHNTAGQRVRIHYSLLSEKQRDEAETALLKQIAQLTKSGRRIKPHMLWQLSILKQNILQFEREATNNE